MPSLTGRTADGMKDGDTSQRHYSAHRVRSALFAFAIGKGVSAALTFVFFLLLVRLLDVTDYAAYVLGVALMELALAVGTLGLDWVASTWLPVFRVRAGTRGTHMFIVRLGSIQILVYVLVAGVLFTAAPQVLLLSGGILTVELVHAIAILVAVEGCGRLLRDQMLGLLLRQGAAQIAQVLRSFVALALVTVASLDTSSRLNALRVAQFESIAATVALLVAAVLLVRHLRSEARVAADPAWEWPSSRQMVKLALHTYLTFLLSLAYGPQVMTALVANLADPATTALYGFCRTFTDQVRRYLPAELLIGLLRPVLVARYAATGDFRALSGAGMLLTTFSVIALGGVLAVFWGVGGVLMYQMSAGRYSDAWPAMVGLLLTLIPFSVRKILETIANTVQLSRLGVVASTVLCVAPLVVVPVLNQGGGVAGVAAVVFGAECLFVVVMLVGLALAGKRVDLDAKRQLKLLLSISAAGAIGFMSNRSLELGGLGGGLSIIALIVLSYAFMLRITGAIGRADIDLIRKVIGFRGLSVSQ